MHKNATAGISTLILFNSFQWVKEISLSANVPKIILKIFLRKQIILKVEVFPQDDKEPCKNQSV